ncbi:phospholipase A [uncultured Cytophaga sp.]|uniref:phospholipase A n=1 Tax=uncultured Cytophaga sp. TaxID=160238 RepID=UPI002631AA07|nr:phospholipase A [uncultured Cytophaga sp.]
MLKNNNIITFTHFSKIFTLLILIISFQSITLLAQEKIQRDSITRILKSQPSFTIYKDNYFITGTTFDESPTIKNSDIKMQISFKQRITNSSLPFKSYLYLTFTQKSFWKIYEKSSPFQENIFNPGLGLGKFIFKNGKQIGVLMFQVEHESNGRDSTFSRSWNYTSVSYMALLSPQITVIAKAWIPFSMNDNNNITDFAGYGEVTINWEIIKNKLQVNALIRKGAKLNLNGSIQTGIYYNPLKHSNQYIYLQFYDGYGENLLNYDRLTNKIRLGICIHPSMGIFNH